MLTNPSMPKLFLNVAACLLLTPLVTLAQAPAGPAQVPAGPDAVPANLVNTVCSSCHPLDRVRNKVADSEAWTAIVTRMKEKGDEGGARIPKGDNGAGAW